MIRILATIRLYTGVGYRQTPFTTGYRPLFNFVPEMKISGHMTLLDRLAFFPGEQGVAEIGLLSNAYLGKEVGAGTQFTFGEGIYRPIAVRSGRFYRPIAVKTCFRVRNNEPLQCKQYS